MSEKHYFELGILLKSMRDGDPRQTYERFTMLKENHQHGPKSIKLYQRKQDLALFDPYSLVVDWFKTYAQLQPESGLDSYYWASYHAQPDVVKFSDPAAKQKLAAQICDAAWHIAQHKPKLGYEIASRLKDCCSEEYLKEYSTVGEQFDYTAIREQADIMRAKIHVIGSPFPWVCEHFKSSSSARKYRKCDEYLAWLESTWKLAGWDKELDRHPSPYDYTKEEIMRRLLHDPEFRYTRDVQLIYKFQGTKQDPFDGNPLPSLEDAGLAFLEAMSRYDVEDYPDRIYNECKYGFQKFAPPGSLIAQSAQSLLQKTVARHSVTVPIFMKQGREILQALQASASVIAPAPPAPI